jgi:hypothetical protein
VYFKDETIPIYACISPVENIIAHNMSDLTVSYEELKPHMAVSWTYLFHLNSELERKKSSIERKASLSLQKKQSLPIQEELKEFTHEHPLLIYDIKPLCSNEAASRIKHLFNGSSSSYTFSGLIISRDNPLFFSFLLTERTWFFPRTYRMISTNDYDYLFLIKSNAPELRIMNHIEIASYTDYPFVHPYYEMFKKEQDDISEYEKIQMDEIKDKNWCQLYKMRTIMANYKKAIKRKEDVTWFMECRNNPNYKMELTIASV